MLSLVTLLSTLEYTSQIFLNQGAEESRSQEPGEAVEGGQDIQIFDINALFGAFQAHQVQLTRLQSEMGQRRETSMDTV